jgi:hypothetical protein
MNTEVNDYINLNGPEGIQTHDYYKINLNSDKLSYF